MKFHRGLMDRDTLEAFLIRRVDQNALKWIQPVSTISIWTFW